METEYVLLDDLSFDEQRELEPVDEDDPLALMIQEEDRVDTEGYDVKASLASITETTGVTTMSTTKTLINNEAIAKLLGMVNAYVEPVDNVVVAKPAWLEIKGTVTPDNSFAISAGVVKAARRIIDGIGVAQRRAAAVSEEIATQQQRAVATSLRPRQGTAQVTTALGVAFRTALDEAEKLAVDGKGYNPDGVEFQERLAELETELAEHEGIVTKGAQMLEELLEWIGNYGEHLGLKVEVGTETVVDFLGNKTTVPRMVPLSADTLVLGIARQKQFIASQRARR